MVGAGESDLFCVVYLCCHSADPVCRHGGIFSQPFPSNPLPPPLPPEYSPMLAVSNFINYISNDSDITVILQIIIARKSWSETVSLSCWRTRNARVSPITSPIIITNCHPRSVQCSMSGLRIQNDSDDELLSS